jgi:hypothetical protein
MSIDQDIESVSVNIQQIALSLVGERFSSRLQENENTLRFDGFAGRVIVSLDGNGLTITESRSDVVIYSTFIGTPCCPERALQVAGNVCNELLCLYQQAVLTGAM